MAELPLGKATGYTDKYDPELLFGIPRSESRVSLGIDDELPFSGTDIWTAWELTWLDADGKPVIATASIELDATSPNIIESKSMKLYLNSLAMTRYDTTKRVEKLIGEDLTSIAEDPVKVSIFTGENSAAAQISPFPGNCIDTLKCKSITREVQVDALKCESDLVVREELHSHLLRSNCPVTNQPDIGSVMIRYHGPKIDRSSLLSYIVSYREHNDFHEACVERMFLDIKAQCKPETLTVYARYNRRGGLDINPFRTDSGESPPNLRLWRQ